MPVNLQPSLQVKEDFVHLATRDVPDAIPHDLHAGAGEGAAEQLLVVTLEALRNEEDQILLLEEAKKKLA